MMTNTNNPMTNTGTSSDNMKYQFTIQPQKDILLQLKNIQLHIKKDFQNYKPQTLGSTSSPSQKEKNNYILQWYLNNIIRKQSIYNNGSITFPKICLLKTVMNSFNKYLTSPKILNMLFVDENAIKDIIRQANTFVDIGFVLQEYVSRKALLKKQKEKNGFKYPQEFYLFLFQRIKDLLWKKDQQEKDQLFRIKHIKAFFQNKKSKPKEPCELITAFLKEQLTQEINLIYTYVFAPNFKQNQISMPLKQNLYKMTYWLVLIDDWNSSQNQLLLYHISLSLYSIVCQPQYQTNYDLIRVFGIIIDMLSIKYHQQDNVKHVGLTPLLNLFRHLSDKFKQVIVTWSTNNQIKRDILKDQQVQNIFRNSMHTGSNAFTFYLIKYLSQYLKSLKKYDVLFYIFQSFIKKDFIRFKLPNKSYLPSFFDLIYLYGVGFINRDRFDGQTQLDQLTKNLQYMLFRQGFNFDQCAQKIILFYKIYQYRFLVLSPISKKFMQDLETIYRKQISVAQIHNNIGNYRIDDMNDFNQEYMPQLYQLKKSDRYVGITNLGNICYMSSFMQALFMTKKFKALILEARDQGKIPSSLTKTQALINLFTQLSKGNYSGQREVDPIKFKEETPEQFKNSWEQHDTGQFGRMYLDSLTRQLKELKPNKNQINKSQIKNQALLKDKIERLFYNKIQNKFICNKCRTAKSRSQNLLDFILTIDKKAQTVYVSELLKRFFEGQELDSNNLIYCQKCKKNTQVHAIPQPIQFPQYLVNTISIFEFSGIGKKIIKPFQFQFILNFKNILPHLKLPDITYTLYAFIVHLGDLAERGHYVCYARNLQENPMIWYCFDDGYVTERQISKSQDFKFADNETPYILFYSSSRKTRISVNNAKDLVQDSFIRMNSMGSKISGVQKK